MDDFALRLHQRLTTEGNLVWSPYSVATVLALVAAGARGRTRDELVQALGEPPEQLRLADAAALEDAEIAVAAALWARRGLPFEDAYRATVAGFPGGTLHNADFAGDPESVRQAINTDVAKTTRDLIKDLLSPGTVDRDTAAVIVSALYLKAAWLQGPFEQASPGRFHGTTGPREVPTMRRTERLPYAESGGWRMVTLDADGPLAVDVLLGDGSVPAPDLLRELRRTARTTRVALSLPRFRVESQASLTDPLRELGVVAALGSDADFSAMTPGRVYLDAIEHKAVLDVDEDGFEGAAATAAVMALMSVETSRPVEFRVDRPFLAVVRHPETGAVFFVARVTDPAG